MKDERDMTRLVSTILTKQTKFLTLIVWNVLNAQVFWGATNEKNLGNGTNGAHLTDSTVTGNDIEGEPDAIMASHLDSDDGDD